MAIAYGVTEMLWRGYHDLGAQRAARSWGDGYSPWNAHDGFQLGPPRRQRLTVLADGVPTGAEVEWGAAGPRVRLPEFEGVPYTSVMHPQEPPYRYSMHFAGDSNPLYVLHDMRQTELRRPTYELDATDEAGDGASVRAPIVGRVAKVFVKAGQAVAKGDRVAVVEAMKMEHVLHAPRDGTVKTVVVTEGEQVAQGALVAILAQ
jgi:3-methylcrotonyl-CoA carboxylase alpha subunit